MIVKISPSDKKEIKRIVEIYNFYPECFESTITYDFLNFSLKNKNFHLFAFKNNIVYGFCGIYFYNSEICEIGPIATDKKFLNRNIATNLLRFVLYLANELKVKKCFVKVKKGNLPAINLFLKFFDIESIENDIIFMKKSFSFNNFQNIPSFHSNLYS